MEKHCSAFSPVVPVYAILHTKIFIDYVINLKINYSSINLYHPYLQLWIP
ncbi:hypothetical protein [Bacillus cereus]|nr:hypothetical protein [Bacillus cereus]